LPFSEPQITAEACSQPVQGWLDGIVAKTRYREIQSDLTGKRQTIDEEITVAVGPYCRWKVVERIIIDQLLTPR